MKIFTSIPEWQNWRAVFATGTLGFVPTMGALHLGHFSLIETSLNANKCTVVSIFVNPEQFDDKQDFDVYPSDIQTDLKLLEKVGVDVVLMPDVAQMYPDNYRFKVMESEFSQQLCGAHRPGHFDAVLTVVMRLLNLVKADNAYFGEKDYQQLQLIRDMTAAFFLQVNIVGCFTVREADGLAMSSRNQHLGKSKRVQAAKLYATLKQSHSANEAREALQGQGFDVDYVEDIPGRRLVAAWLGSTRLIDNVEI